MVSRKFVLVLLSGAALWGGRAAAQDPNRWRRFENQPGQPPSAAPPPPAQAEIPLPPPQLTVPAGKFITVRLNEPLDSNHNQSGDAFSATLVEPVVIDGFVMARRGQPVNGRVIDVQKSGRVSGTSRLRIELTELNLVDGQQAVLKTSLIQRTGDTSVDRDVGAIAGTSALGAALGAAVDGGGFGAGVGALAGAGAGLIGVLTTRGRPTVVYPETVLTFRIDAPLTVSTVRSGNAFTQVTGQDYSAYSNGQGGPRLVRRSCAGGGCAPPPVYPYPYGYSYPYFGYSGFYPWFGTSIGFYSGPRFYGHYRRW